MTFPQYVYLAMVVSYAIFFVMFLRFFLWKQYSEKNYWRRRPGLSLESLQELSQELSTPLPRFTVMVPARNEADVIAKTIQHMNQLNYPKERYELIVVTDAKELIRKQEDKPPVVMAAAGLILQGTSKKGSVDAVVEELVLCLLTHLSLGEIRAFQARGGYGENFGMGDINLVSAGQQETLLREIARELVKRRGRININRLYHLFRRLAPELTDGEIRRVYPGFLSVAVPVVAFYCGRRRDLSSRVIPTMIRYTAQAHHEVTRKILWALTERVNATLEQQIRLLQQQNRLMALIEKQYDECFPTTQAIVERLVVELANSGGISLKHVVVPDDFDGELNGICTGSTVASTKGRALNFAMREVAPSSVMCAYFDAEGRPDFNVLLYVAYQHLKRQGEVKIFQGPVFQVRNFYEMGPFCKVASLYQCVSHDWYMPVLFQRIPFVGGTNVFVDRELLEQIGGFDHTTLTEDLELGTRAYLKAGVWPEYLPYGSSEQTPPTFRSFFRQRLRWGTGHLQVMEKIFRDDSCDQQRKIPLLKNLFIKGQAEWTLYQTITFLPPVAAILWWNGLVDYTIVPYAVRAGMNSLYVLYLSFLVYLVYRYSSYFDPAAKPYTLAGQCGAVLQLFILPFAAFFFPAPYTSALLLKRFNRQPKTWAKTPRTRE